MRHIRHNQFLAKCTCLSVVAFCALALAVFAVTPVLAQSVATDRVDYAAGDVALITGAGWEPGEVVALEISQAPSLHAADTLYAIAEYVIADEAGNIRSGYAVPGHDVAQVFTLKATGQTSGFTAQMTFTNSLSSAAVIPPVTPTTLVQTDKGDYAPGETAIITGTGWLPGETVNLELVEDPLVHPAETLHAIADNAGNIYAGYVVDEHDLGRTFTLTAAGQTSGLTAQMTFTDANLCGTPSSQCTSGECCNTATCTFKPGTAVCRTAAPGSCDQAETCTGTSAACPADVKKPAGTVCRAAASECDLAESCDGVSNNCPADSFKTAGTACTDDGNVCTRDICDGAGACTHPAGNAGTECRAAAGECDIAEVCDGLSTSCPGDGFKTAGTECRAAAGACDQAETCTGTSATCPADAVKTAGTECRAAAGDCDVAEVCDGSSKACPADGFKSSSVVCRASAGVCDLAENCTGTGPSCPADAKSTALCRAAVGQCDVAEYCDGVNNNCPQDQFVSAATLCTGASQGGACDDDAADRCSGTSNTCVDAFKSSATVCRASGGQCDVAEYCTGTSGACPADGFALATASCNDGNACTQGDHCSGTANMCVNAGYSWSGMLQPINADGSSVFKLGSTIPVKFKLTGACAGISNFSAQIYIAKVSNNVAGTDAEATSTSAADTGNYFRYDATNDQYIFNLATKSLSQGTWQISIYGDLYNPPSKMVWVSLKK